MSFFLGIDGGGTRTVALLADAAGQFLGRAESGPSNPLKVGFPAAEREILNAVRACLKDAGIPSARGRAARHWRLQAVCAGVAGVDRRAVHQPLIAWMRRHLPARRHLLTSDAAIALAAAVRDQPGIVVIAGTGSIAFARDEQGQVLRAGGWGIPFDDRGSGYDIGRGAVTAALEAFDGRGTNTVLTGSLCRRLGLKDISDVIAQRLEQQQIAALFPLVAEAAQNGDLVARHLCGEAARRLAELAEALLQRAGWMGRTRPVVITGGVFESSEIMRRAFSRHLRRVAPRARVELLRRRPVEGALWLASTGGKSKH